MIFSSDWYRIQIFRQKVGCYVLPKDPIILESYINMKLRDEGVSLQEFCDAEGIDRAELEERLAAAGFCYDAETNRFR